ncbi:MAG: hypothetical protein NTY88_09865 [Bacteroidetes bacterium]|nr:hypothetical protein [Bacteroidota bacterium]
MKQFFTYLTLFAWFFTTASCKKDSGVKEFSAEDNTAIETEYSQIFDVVADYLSSDTLTHKTDNNILPEGVIISFIDRTYSDSDGVVCQLDYGPLEHSSSYKGIPCRDGRYRAGKLTLAMSKHWTDVGTVLIVTINSSDEYYVGDGERMYKLSGWETITRTGDSMLTVEIENATLQRENGSMSWTASQTVRLLNGNSYGLWNTAYEISGTSQGTNKNGDAFTAEIISPAFSLEKNLSLGCLGTFVSGNVSIVNTVNSADNKFAIDYGEGNCDNSVTLMSKNGTRTIQVW